MKKLFAVSFLVLLISLFTYSALSQEGTEYIVTAEDIQVCFPFTTADGVVVRQWYSPGGSVVSYSAEPVGVDKPKARLGLNRFEGLLQADEPGLGKAVMDIKIVALPAPDRRTMEFRFRVRSPDGSVISEWSEATAVKFVGKPGVPAHVEIPTNPL